MQTFRDKKKFRPDFWLPAILLILPVTMMLLPLIYEVHPRRGLFYTPLLIKMFLVTTILYAIFTGALRGRAALQKPYFLGLAFTLILIALYTSFFSAIDAGFSFEKLLDLGLIIVFSYFAKNLFERTGPHLVFLSLLAIFWAMVLAVPVLAVLFYLQLPDNGAWPNFLPGFVHVRIYGFSLTVAIAVGTGLLATAQLAKPKVFVPVLLGLLVLWAALFWTGSRGGILALVLVFPVMMVLLPKSRKAIVLGFLVMVVGGFLSLLLPVPSQAYGFFNAFGDTFESASVNRFSSGRITEWQLILGFINQNPLFGHGFGQTNFIVAEVMPPHAHVHNIVLEAALAWGWIGAFCAAVLILVSWFKGLIKARSSNDITLIPAFLLVNVLMVYAWVDGVYFYYQTLVPLAVCVAALWAHHKPPQATPATGT